MTNDEVPNDEGMTKSEYSKPCHSEVRRGIYVPDLLQVANEIPRRTSG